jgi:4a-hydroxytetrahydrobiopterin dehydratase
MQRELAQSKCVACRAGEPTLTSEEIALLQPQVIGWSIVERSDIKRLERVFKFKDFAEALAFTNKVGQITEDEGHYPSILTEWGIIPKSNLATSGSSDDICRLINKRIQLFPGDRIRVEFFLSHPSKSESCIPIRVSRIR